MARNEAGEDKSEGVKGCLDVLWESTLCSEHKEKSGKDSSLGRNQKGLG